MNETTFENAKVGDRVWSSEYGWGTIVVILFAPFPLHVQFIANNFRDTYGQGGNRDTDVFQTLFWDEIKFEAPPRPKRMVKKVVEGWINIYVYETGAFMFPNIYDTKEKALKSRGYLKPVGEPLFIHHEYEVEE